MFQRTSGQCRAACVLLRYSTPNSEPRTTRYSGGFYASTTSFQCAFPLGPPWRTNVLSCSASPSTALSARARGHYVSQAGASGAAGVMVRLTTSFLAIPLPLCLSDDPPGILSRQFPPHIYNWVRRRPALYLYILENGLFRCAI